VSRLKNRRYGGYTVHLYDWDDIWQPDDHPAGQDPPTFASLDYALIVAKRVKQIGTVERKTSVRRDGQIVATVGVDGTVQLIQPPKPSRVLP
jgi:hypothetical protein